MRKFNSSEYQYINLVKKIINKGEKKTGRNGNVLSLFGEKMEFNLNNYSVPILTTKKMAWRTCIKELIWFINGQTDNKILKSQNVNIWNDNASESFKKTRGIVYESKGDLGPIYGHQWRHFNAKYNGCNEDYTNQGIDQLQNIVSMLSDPTEKMSRRIFLSAWNPCQLDQMVLPPCHVSSHYIVNSKDELSCAVYQRSGDIGLGVPFNIASYSVLTCLLAKHSGLKPGKLVHFIGDAHIYIQHVPTLLEQIKSPPKESPILNIYKRDVLERYTLDDFKLYNYQFHETEPMKMVA
jgi:thymidylate synthase